MSDFETIKTPLGESVTIRKHDGPGAVMKKTLIHYITAGWMFNRWYEKLVISTSFWWAVYSLIKWIV